MDIGKKNRLLTICFLVLLVLGGFLRLYRLDDKWLWQDEAELALYARQILKGEMPNAFVKDRDTILYIGVLIPFTKTTTEFGYVDPSMYGYYQEDYVSDGRLVKHPFGDIMLTALSFFFLGDSTFSTRFPFAFLGILSLFFTFKLGALLYNRRVALMAVGFQTFNILLILYERQARYYSPYLFFFLGTAYFSLKAFDGNRLSSYVWAALFFVALCFTMPLAPIAIAVIMVVYNLYRHKSWQWLYNRNFGISLLLVVLFVVPYLFAYQPWKAFNAEVVELSLATKFFRTGAYLIGLAVNMPFFLVVAGLVLMCWKRSKSEFYIFIVITIPAILYSLIMVSSSFYERMYIIAVPFFAIAAGFFLDAVYGFMSTRFRQSTGLLVLYLLLLPALFLPKVVFSYGINMSLDQYPYKLKRWSFLTVTVHRMLTGRDFGFLTWSTKETDWVKEAHAFLQSKGTAEDEWVFMTIQNTTLLYYTDLKAQLIWPVRASYLDAIQDRFWILIDPDEANKKYSMGNFYYGTFNPPQKEHIKKRHYEERIKDCTRHVLPSGALAYECN